MRGPGEQRGQTGEMRETGKGQGASAGPETVLVTSPNVGAFMIRLTDKMGIFLAVNTINKQRYRNSPSSPRKYSCPLLLSM